MVGSLFYGTVLGIFLVAFYIKHVRGSAVFLAALVAEGVVVYCAVATEIAFLWYSVIGCAAVILTALLIQAVTPDRELKIEN